jgi:hypothetical protein
VPAPASGPTPHRLWLPDKRAYSRRPSTPAGDPTRVTAVFVGGYGSVRPGSSDLSEVAYSVWGSVGAALYQRQPMGASQTDALSPVPPMYHQTHDHQPALTADVSASSSPVRQRPERLMTVDKTMP